MPGATVAPDARATPGVGHRSPGRSAPPHRSDRPQTSSACLFTIGEEWALRWPSPGGASGKAPPGRRWSDRVLRWPSRGRSAVWSRVTSPRSGSSEATGAGSCARRPRASFSTTSSAESIAPRAQRGLPGPGSRRRGQRENRPPRGRRPPAAPSAHPPTPPTGDRRLERAPSARALQPHDSHQSRPRAARLLFTRRSQKRRQVRRGGNRQSALAPHVEAP